MIKIFELDLLELELFKKILLIVVFVDRLSLSLYLSLSCCLYSHAQEMLIHEQDKSFLSKEYKHMLDNDKKIERDFKASPRNLEFLNG